MLVELQRRATVTGAMRSVSADGGRVDDQTEKNCFNVVVTVYFITLISYARLVSGSLINCNYGFNSRFTGGFFIPEEIPEDLKKIARNVKTIK